MSQSTNKKLHAIKAFKKPNHIKEQQELVKELKEEFGSFHGIMRSTGTPLKTVYEWCLKPKERKHKGTERSAR